MTRASKIIVQLLLFQLLHDSHLRDHMMYQLAHDHVYGSWGFARVIHLGHMTSLLGQGCVRGNLCRNLQQQARPVVIYSQTESYCLGRLVDRFVTKLLVGESKKEVDKDLSVITSYIDKISSPVLDSVLSEGGTSIFIFRIWVFAGYMC